MEITDEAPHTGDQVVDEALARVAHLGEQPLTQHPAVYRVAQDALQEFLSSPQRSAIPPSDRMASTGSRAA